MTLEATFLKHDITYGAQRITVTDIGDLSQISLTGNWSTGLLNTEHRALLNWTGADFLAVDIDGDMPLQVAVGKMASSGYRYFIGTTSSHQQMKGKKPPCDRFRIVVQLTTRCVDLADWAETYAKVTSDLGLPADPQARDAVRYWKPCTTIVSLRTDGATVDVVRSAPRSNPTLAIGDRPAGMVQDEAGARADVASWEPAVQGKNGSGVAMALAVRLVRGRGLTPERAVDIMEPWNAKCEPPWSEAELLHKCRDAETRGKVPWGYLFYHGTKAEVLARALPKYGPAGTSGVPYRVWPDGRMLMLNSEDAVKIAIAEVWQDASGEEASVATVRMAFDWWRMKVNITDACPKPLVVNEEAGPALCRLETVPGPCPAWDEFLSRLSAPDTFLAWVWMVTLKDASRQILWLQGAGQDGKSVVNSVLASALDSAAITMDDSFMDKAERWMGSAVFGKRLVIVDDTKMRSLTRRGPIHRLSGRSPMMCEFKGQQGFMFVPNVAIICTSNLLPEIGDNRADRSRLLPIKVAPTDRKVDHAWAGRLRAEMPQLLNRARKAYERLALRPGEAHLNLEPAVAELVEEAASVDGNAFMEQMDRGGIVFKEGGVMTGRELMSRLGVQDATEAKYRDFCAWLRQQPGVEQVRTKHAREWRGIGGAA